MARTLIVAAVLTLVGCGYADQLDGVVDHKANCCTLISASRISECVASFARRHVSGYCSWVTCYDGRTYTATELADGTISSCDPVLLFDQQDAALLPLDAVTRWRVDSPDVCPATSR